jgi:hypothetical protein
MNGLDEKRRRALETFQMRNKEINEDSYRAYEKCLLEVENTAKLQIEEELRIE